MGEIAIMNLKSFVALLAISGLPEILLEAAIVVGTRVQSHWQKITSVNLRRFSAVAIPPKDPNTNG
jgi:hypothetical protein